MPGTALERAFRHDRAVVLAAIGIVTALAWAYVLWLASRMAAAGHDMAMPGMAMMAPAIAPWTAADFAWMAAMWAVMMVGMMLPSVAPMVLIYAGVARKALGQGKPFASTGWFAAGYLLAWTGFAVAATVAQMGLEQAALLSPMTMATGERLGGIVLVLAGLYQWTRLKDRCLAQCQAPLVFIQRHGGFRRDPAGALGLGVRHGLYCVGCCWALMGLLFVVGVMNVLWIAAIAGFVLLEKVVPAGRGLSRVAGAALVGAGIWLLLR
jgi:predicted metal-binding membrane protein